MSDTQLALPAHVPPTLVRDFDAFGDQRLIDDPFGLFREMANTYPSVFYSTRHGGHWVVTGRQAVEEALSNSDTFGSGVMAIPNVDAPAMFIPVQLDPPSHTLYRTMLNPMFRPAAIWKLENEVRAFARDLIDAVKDRGECEFVDTIALPLPVLIFMRQMDLPEHRYQQFAAWVRELLTGQTQQQRDDGSAKIIEYIRSVVMEREADANGDWVRKLLAAEVEGRPLDREREVWPICNLLFVGGLDTVKNGLSHMMRALSSRPDLQQRLRDDPSIAPAAVEEMMHFLGGVNPPRVLRHDTDFMGVKMRARDLAIMYTPTAAGDRPADINDPSTINFDRENKTHIAFGAGRHRCIGAVLARLEMKVFLQEWFASIPSFEVTPGSKLTYSPGLATSVEELHLRWPRRS